MTEVPGLAWEPGLGVGVTSEHGLLHVVVAGMGEAGRAPIHLKLLYRARICWLVALHLGAAESVNLASSSFSYSHCQGKAWPCSSAESYP